MNDYLDYIEHSGVLNQRWHHRRYQNYDGSLTSEGRRHYGIGPPRSKGEKIAIKAAKRAVKEKRKYDKYMAKNAKKKGYTTIEEFKAAQNKPNYSPDYKKPISEYTDDELETLRKRLDLEKKVRDLMPVQTNKASKIINKLNTAAAVTKGMSDTYSNIGKIINTTRDITGKNKNDKDNKKKKDKKDKD